MSNKSYRTNEMTVLDAIAILSANFTAAITDIISSNAHGLKDKDMVVLTTTGTLPAGLETSTVYYVKKIDANTFYLHTTPQLETADRVNVTDTGTGTHTFTMHDIGYTKDVEDFDSISILFGSESSANVKTEFLISDKDDEPDFSAAATVSNHYDGVDVVDNEDNSNNDGDTGIVLSGTDDVRNFEINVERKKWFNARLSNYVAGKVTVKIVGHKFK